MTTILSRPAPSSGALPENSAAALAALAAGKPALVWRKLIADSETPVSAARKLFVPERGDFLLESVQGGEVRGRYSLVGLDPDLVFRATGETAQLNPRGRPIRLLSPRCRATASPNCARWSNAAGSTCPKACRPRWPAWSAISAMKPSVWWKNCRVRRKARSNCPTCCSCAPPWCWCSIA
jgi:hypothetical protein